MRWAGDHWAIRSLILAVLALAYYCLVVQSIGWVAASTTPNYQGWSEAWQVYAHMSVLHLLAITIAALPIAIALVLLIAHRTVAFAIILSLPAAIRLIVDVFVRQDEALTNPMPAGQWLVHGLGAVYLAGTPAALTLLLRRLLPAHSRTPEQA